MLRLNRIILLLILPILSAASPAMAAPILQLMLPLGRTVYQTNEIIDIAAVRSDTAALSAGNLELSVTGADGSKLSFTFPAEAVGIVGPDARSTEVLHLNSWYLRPGHYTIQVTVDGATASTDIDVYSNIRKSSYRLVNWGTAKGNDELDEGEDGMGYNLFYGPDDASSDFIRAGLDYMNVCTMSGGHQMDLRSECDWSDPYVIAGGTARVAKRALMDRTKSNCIGVHFYDEPGLTWEKDPVTGDFTPHAVASQHASYIAATGKDAVHYNKLDPNNPAIVADWTKWAKWKLGFMDAAWQDAKFGVNYVMPDYLTATQSQYGFTAFTDGYYFNVVRSLPVISGHGGYDDYWMMYFNPNMYLEFARARDFAKPNWYLPTWYGNTPNDRMRMEDNLVFATGIQGLITPPGLDPTHANTLPAAPAIVEGNKLYQRLGTIFTGNEVTRCPVGMLDSLSESIHYQIEDPINGNYANSSPQGKMLQYTYLAGKMIQQPFTPILDEDVLDGTAAAYEKAIIVTGCEYLDPRVIAGLEAFIRGGGIVYKVCGATVDIKGSIDLPGTTPVMPDAAAIKAASDAKKWNLLPPLTTIIKDEIATKPLADKLKAALDADGIAPVFVTNEQGLSAFRQQRGEIEYLFAVNTAPDPATVPDNRVRAITARITLPADGRPVYDAVSGGLITSFVKKAGGLTSSFRFGPGQMRVFARTDRPIGSIKVGKPSLYRDYTVAQAPVHIDFSATLLDTTGGVISGTAPLEIKLIDPLGSDRYTLYRATELGVANISLPLALNDPDGTWKVVVKELLSNTSSTATFNYAAVSSCGVIAGETRRAVYFGNDRKHIFRFFRLHKDITIAIGSSPYDQVAASRLADSVKPWDVRCTIVNATDIAHARVLTADEAGTWVGLDYAGSGQIKPGGNNPPSIAGFDVKGAVVLIGNPDDNAIIKFMNDQKVLPYTPVKDIFPGRGRGYIAWQYDMIGHSQESITAIAYDDAGMAQAIGTLYEALAGIDPLTPFTQPTAATITVATVDPNKVAPLSVAWNALLPDNAVEITAAGNGYRVTCQDGSISALSVTGVLTRSTVQAPIPAPTLDPVVPPALAKSVRTDRQVKFVVADAAGHIAVGYWGGLIQVFDATGKLVAQTQLNNDVTSMLWNGGKLIVGQSDAHLTAFSAA